ncbi:hypothetical protein M378DRAFT_116858 [Amanita muscaria Koide BX008]|uniref:Pentatricopeptide repeat protein n=1 Tax=Amanita muscaria (strain Koide BX008) TaxID=946122 RepID=A0A0C2T2K6_AMAMK|nr:hypothetical protein M378DRAFT_116858 [Amanita muscaria Koide BX008]
MLVIRSSRLLCCRAFSTSSPVSARRPPSVDDAAEAEKPRLPRYVRRQLAFGDVAAEDTPKPSGEKRVFRSKHYDPSKTQTPKTDMKMLEPHVLSKRLKKLCDANQIDAAVSMVKNAPLDAQNAPVWNTLIWEAMKAKRFKLAYLLFTDMKRRGHSPTTRTFQTMFTGFSRVEHWSTHPKQLANVRSLYEAYQRHIASVKREDPSSPHLSVDPLAAYIKILGDAGRFQDIFDVYYALDSEGPLAPNQLIFTAIFQALAPKVDMIGDRAVPYLKNAADAKLLWKQMLKASQKSPGFKVDSYIASAAVAALTRGGPSEQAFAFQIVRDYFGLYPPDESAPTEFLPLPPACLDVILRLCNYTKKHDLCLHFVQQVKRRPEDLGGPSILDRRHMEEVLKALLGITNTNRKFGSDQALATVEWMLRQEVLGKNGPKIRPTFSTFGLVMTACWHSGDWQSAARTFELMTGYHAHDFADGAVAMSPKLDKRSPDRYLTPTPEIASSMIRAALGSSDRSSMRQCLRMIYHLGLDNIMRGAGTESNKAAKNRAFWASKLNAAILEIVESVRGQRDIPEEAKKWEELKIRTSRLEAKLQTESTSSFIPTQEKAPRKRRTTDY